MTNSGPSCVNHPRLGRIRGLLSNDGKTVQFRNLKFAQVPGRWEDPELYSQRPSPTEYDARAFGPSCPQKTGAVDFDLSLIGNVSLPYEELPQSEFECLHLVVTVPVSDPARLFKLPVMVWVHGGGFSIGSNSYPQYDLGNFVAASAALKLPFIGVAINYRVGILGFLASEDLGTTGNYGLKDQVCAFLWIKKNIAGFGGDAENITAFGESAGAISISALLLANKPLFTRAILMSGEITVRNIRSKNWQNDHYRTNIKLLGFDRLPLNEQKFRMYQIEANELVNCLPMFQHWSPSVDGKLLTEEVDLGMLSNGKNSIGKPIWCKEIVIGDMEHDGTVLRSRFVDDPLALQRLQEATQKILSPNEGIRLLKEYKIIGNSSSDIRKRDLVELITDLRFYLSTIKTHEGWRHSGNPKSYRYHFHQPNPVEGSMKGLASHEFDIAILFQNIHEYLPCANVSLALDLTKIWADFAHGSGWRSGFGEGEVLVFGPDHIISAYSASDYDRKFRGGRGELMQDIGWKKCFTLGEVLQGCYSGAIIETAP